MITTIGKLDNDVMTEIMNKQDAYFRIFGRENIMKELNRFLDKSGNGLAPHQEVLRKIKQYAPSTPEDLEFYIPNSGCYSEDI
jgi:hypothetical protein